MRLIELGDATTPVSLAAEASPAVSPAELARIVPLRDRRTPTRRPYDDLRELTVVVWARTKLIEHRLDGREPLDPQLLTSLADIEAAVAAIGVRLDALEDALPRRAA